MSERTPSHRLEPGDELKAADDQRRTVVQGGDQIAVYCTEGSSTFYVAVWDEDTWRTQGIRMPLRLLRWRAQRNSDGDGWAIFDGDRDKNDYAFWGWADDCDADLDELVPKLVDWLNKEHP